MWRAPLLFWPGAQRVGAWQEANAGEILKFNGVPVLEAIDGQEAADVREKEEEKARATPMAAIVAARAHRMRQPRPLDPPREPRAPSQQQARKEAERLEKAEAKRAAKDAAAGITPRGGTLPRGASAGTKRPASAAAGAKRTKTDAAKPPQHAVPSERVLQSLGARQRPPSPARECAHAPTVVRVTAHRHRRREPRVSAPSRPCRHRLVQ